MNIENAKILVVGDIMLDHYIVGEVKRISPEAPVPILNVTKEYSTLGGCGNVVRNIVGMGAEAICLSIIGPDETGMRIMQHLEIDGITDSFINMSRNMITTKKTRIVSGSQETQMLRVDEENFITHDLSNNINKLPSNIDVIVVSDYNKGVVTKELIEALKTLQKPIIVDPKPRSGSENIYDGVFLITPNQKEFDEMKMPSNVEYVLKTMGKDGMELNGYDSKIHIPTTPSTVYNVSGAGDTVVAALSVCMACDIDLLSATKIANECAGYVVTKKGTSTVPSEVFIKIVESYKKGDL